MPTGREDSPGSNLSFREGSGGGGAAVSIMRRIEAEREGEGADNPQEEASSASLLQHQQQQQDMKESKKKRVLRLEESVGGDRAPKNAPGRNDATSIAASFHQRQLQPAQTNRQVTPKQQQQQQQPMSIDARRGGGGAAEIPGAPIIKRSRTCPELIVGPEVRRKELESHGFKRKAEAAIVAKARARKEAARRGNGGRGKKEGGGGGRRRREEVDGSTATSEDSTMLVVTSNGGEGRDEYDDEEEDAAPTSSTMMVTKQVLLQTKLMDPEMIRKCKVYCRSLAFFYNLSLSIVFTVWTELLLDDFHNSYAEAATYIGICNCVERGIQFLTAPFLGNLSDVLGRQPVILLSLLLQVLALLAVILRPRASTVLVYFIINGVSNVTWAMLNAVVADLSQQSEDYHYVFTKQHHAVNDKERKNRLWEEEGEKKKKGKKEEEGGKSRSKKEGEGMGGIRGPW